MRYDRHPLLKHKTATMRSIQAETWGEQRETTACDARKRAAGEPQ